MLQLFTPLTAALNLVFALAALAAMFVGPPWFEIAAPLGVLAVTGWTVYAAWRAGHDPFAEPGDRAETENLHQ